MLEWMYEKNLWEFVNDAMTLEEILILIPSTSLQSERREYLLFTGMTLEENFCFKCVKCYFTNLPLPTKKI